VQPSSFAKIYSVAKVFCDHFTFTANSKHMEAEIGFPGDCARHHYKDGFTSSKAVSTHNDLGAR
jgi:hypothetical protein